MITEADLAGEFAELFRAVYLTFHRRDRPRSQLPNASLAVLEHLAMAGPLTVGEAAAHLCRAQSVVSEIVSHLERKGMLERESDPADRRRTLVWLTEPGHDALRRQREVLNTDLLAAALSRMPPDQVGGLLDALRALLAPVAGSPVAGSPAVPVAGSPAVPVSGSPAVPVAGSPAVPVSGSPAVPTPAPRRPSGRAGGAIHTRNI